VSYYLLVFDRRRGHLQRYEDFHGDSRRAFRARLREEAAHAPDQDVEVVVLSAGSEEELRATHSRYFRSAEEMLSGA
jgi:hypothetical protein